MGLVSFSELWEAAGFGRQVRENRVAELMHREQDSAPLARAQKQFVEYSTGYQSRWSKIGKFSDMQPVESFDSKRLLPYRDKETSLFTIAAARQQGIFDSYYVARFSTKILKHDVLLVIGAIKLGRKNTRYFAIDLIGATKDELDLYVEQAHERETLTVKVYELKVQLRSATEHKQPLLAGVLSVLLRCLGSLSALIAVVSALYMPFSYIMRSSTPTAQETTRLVKYDWVNALGNLPDLGILPVLVAFLSAVVAFTCFSWSAAVEPKARVSDNNSGATTPPLTKRERRALEAEVTQLSTRLDELNQLVA